MIESLSPSVKWEQRQDIAFLWCDNPPVNAISGSIRAGLCRGIERAVADPAIKAIVILCRGPSFFTGADITEFGKVIDAPSWTETDRTIEISPKPIIAAIHGSCLGGGFEYALTCHYRIALEETRFGFPEIKLGLLPGGGGTQRFPRLAGFEAALDAILSGSSFDAGRALALGVIDRIVEAPLETSAGQFATEVAKRNETPPRARDRTDQIIAFRNAAPAAFAEARRNVGHRFTGRMSPLRAIDAIEAASILPFAEGMAEEARLFEECQRSDEHRALAHLFFAERAARKIPGLTVKEGQPVDRVAVIGAGTMGCGIALAFAAAGLLVALIESDHEAGLRASRRIADELAQAVARKRLSEDQAEAQRGRISLAQEIASAAEASLAVEAVFENLSLKQQVFAQLDRIMPTGAVLATNTSNLDINAIAGVTGRPESVVGLHFFSPANVMQLLEIVRGARTSDVVLATALEVAKRLGKQPVVAGVCDGFITNRIFGEYWRQSRFLVEEGASPYEVDRVLMKFGMPLGPFAVSDLVGLDVSKMIRENRRALAGSDERPDTVEDELVLAGRLGRKNGMGWYRYPAGARAGEEEDEVLRAIQIHRQRTGRQPRAISPDEIIARCIFGVINEGARTVEEGIAFRASDVDVAAVYGYGFPKHRGGPMHFADEFGLRRVAEEVEALHQTQGIRWRPSPLLVETARRGGRLAEARFQ
jgi:3-hydroxyacyl-CoA dehydrogenase